MASVKVCDICGEICENRRRYELIEKGVFSKYVFDICCDCVDKIKSEIKEDKKISKTRF